MCKYTCGAGNKILKIDTVPRTKCVNIDSLISLLGYQ